MDWNNRGYNELDNIFRIKRIYTAFEHGYDKDYYYEGEYHNFWEMVFVVDGKIGVTAGKNVFVLKKGQVILHEPMEFHRLWSEGETCPRVVIFTFSADNMPKYSSKIFEIPDTKLLFEILSGLLETFEFSGLVLKRVKENALISHQFAVKRLECFILETVSQKLGEQKTLKSQMAENYATIVNVLENNIDKNLSVTEIAKLCNMSEINLKKTFSKYSGMGVKKYYNQIKITAAVSMLKQGKSVKETAASLGFLNQNYFSTVFRRITGQPPTSCR